jgi:hypothetical protein
LSLSPHAHRSADASVAIFLLTETDEILASVTDCISYDGKVVDVDAGANVHDIGLMMGGSHPTEQMPGRAGQANAAPRRLSNRQRPGDPSPACCCRRSSWLLSLLTCPPDVDRRRGLMAYKTAPGAFGKTRITGLCQNGPLLLVVGGRSPSGAVWNIGEGNTLWSALGGIVASLCISPPHPVMTMAAAGSRALGADPAVFKIKVA